jgi:hypothetical protein
MAYRGDGFDDPPTAFDEYMTEKLPKYEAKGKTIAVAPLRDAGDTLCMTNKSDLRPIVRLLCMPPERAPYFAAIADSGQIHVVRFAKTNVGPEWTIRFERSDVRCHAEDFTHIVYHVATLKHLGARTEEIRTLSPTSRTLMEIGIDAWKKHAEPLTHYKTTDLLDLTLFCCTKETTNDHRQFAATRLGLDPRGDDAQRSDRPAAGDACQYSTAGHQSDDLLVASPEGRARSGRPRRDLRETGQRNAASAAECHTAAEEEPMQQGLFDW